MKFLIVMVGFFIFHIFIDNRVAVSKVVIHDIDNMVELGSKIENKFVIILIVFYFGLFFCCYLILLFVFLCWTCLLLTLEVVI